MPNEHDESSATSPHHKTRKFLSMYRGTVADKKDPMKLGRVRIHIPGITPEEGGAWAFPINNVGAGAKQRGFFDQPSVGSDVVVWFEQGDIDHPYYGGGNFGTGEVPDEIAEGEVDEQDQFKVYETARWRLKFDDREGKQEAHLEDKLNGNVVELDGVNHAVRIKGAAVVFIESPAQITLQAPAIQLGNRTLTQNGKPIN